MPAKKYFITKEYLEEHYTKQKKSTTTIAKELGLKSTNTLKRLLKKYDIPNNNNRAVGQ